MTNKINKYIRFISLIIAAFTLWQCSKPENEFSDFVTINTEGWRYCDTLTLDVPEYVADSVLQAKLAIVVQHTNNYPYANLWLEVTTPTPVDTVLSVDTLNIRLADTFGNWQGSGTGITYTLVDTISRPKMFVKNKPIRIRHIMRVDTLKGIDRIGIIALK